VEYLQGVSCGFVVLRQLGINFADKTVIAAAQIIVPPVALSNTHRNAGLWGHTVVIEIRLPIDPVSVAHPLLVHRAVRQDNFPDEVCFLVRVNSLSSCPKAFPEIIITFRTTALRFTCTENLAQIYHSLLLCNNIYLLFLIFQYIFVYLIIVYNFVIIYLFYLYLFILNYLFDFFVIV